MVGIAGEGNGITNLHIFVSCCFQQFPCSCTHFFVHHTFVLFEFTVDGNRWSTPLVFLRMVQRDSIFSIGQALSKCIKSHLPCTWCCHRLLKRLSNLSAVGI